MRWGNEAAHSHASLTQCDSNHSLRQTQRFLSLSMLCRAAMQGGTGVHSGTHWAFNKMAAIFQPTFSNAIL